MSITSRFREKLLGILGINRIVHRLELNNKVSILRAREEILNSEKYKDDKRLTKYGFKAYSQGDEDGMIQEIFQRIGTNTKTFIEFGVGNGLENNTIYLLYQGWKGLWIEGGNQEIKFIKNKFAKSIKSKQLKLIQKYITKDNIENLISQFPEGRQLDLLSIDIDGNDYHVFQAIKSIKPRVIVMEYNAKFAPPVKWVMKYNSKHLWDGTDYMGASLKSFEKLFDEKGYVLVGCSINGVNAFFVRKDLVEDKFSQPYTAENHYEPARFWLKYPAGHAANFNDYLSQ
jgi:hypothetical protein